MRGRVRRQGPGRRIKTGKAETGNHSGNALGVQVNAVGGGVARSYARRAHCLSDLSDVDRGVVAGEIACVPRSANPASAAGWVVEWVRPAQPRRGLRKLAQARRSPTARLLERVKQANPTTPRLAG